MPETHAVHGWLEGSDELHGRVQAFIRSPVDDGPRFDDLALDIARFQARHIPGFARLIRSRGGKLESLSDIPAVTCESFRLTRIAAHPPEYDQVRFLTSGTSSGNRGQHCMRRTDTYRLAALTWARQLLVPEPIPAMQVICLAPEPESPPTSSLGFMMQAFLEEFDCDEVSREEQRWLLFEQGVDVEHLQRLLRRAEQKHHSVLLLATSFALAYLLEALAGNALSFSGQLIVMQTGGFKGKTREFPPDELTRALGHAFAQSELHLVSEYGMTELSSQLYDGRIPSARRQTAPARYLAPPWMRVTVLDPVNLQEVSDGDVGLACFLDLANVDSALRILTSDRIIRRGSSVQLLGRSPNSPPRGCSLADEELVNLTT